MNMLKGASPQGEETGILESRFYEEANREILNINRFLLVATTIYIIFPSALAVLEPPAASDEYQNIYIDGQNRCMQFCVFKGPIR